MNNFVHSYVTYMVCFKANFLLKTLKYYRIPSDWLDLNRLPLVWFDLKRPPLDWLDFSLLVTD